MMKSGINKLLICIVLLPGPVFAEPIPEIDCLIEPNMTIELSSPVSGVIDTIVVDRSDFVTQGQILATLKSDVEKVQVITSKENLKLGIIEQQRAAELYKDHVITLSEKEKSDHEMKLFQLDVKQAEANLERHIIRSPIDAVIADRYLMPGEFIQEKPILKLAQLNPLRIEVVSSVNNFGRIKTGMHAQVSTEFGDFENLVGEVVLVDKVIDAASGTFGVRLELPNHDNSVPGGIKCKVRFFTAKEEARYKKLRPHVEAKENDVASAQVEILNCNTIGPFIRKDHLESLMASLVNDIQSYDVREETKLHVSYLVTTEQLESVQAAKQLEAKMKQAGAKDIAILHRSSGVRIALGLFSAEKGAQKRQLKIKKMGYASQVVPQNMAKKSYWANVISNKPAISFKKLVMTSVNNDVDKLKFQVCDNDVIASEK
jgi:pyruvate/2-oxoglutarate dehydrogenase complex dihydrolipoamide acyltransferase (E2) component